MKKCLFLFALFCAAMSSFAQWPTSLEEDPVLITPYAMEDYGDCVLTNKNGVTYIVQVKPDNTTDAGRIGINYVIGICDKDGKMKTSVAEGSTPGIGTHAGRSWTVVNTIASLDRDGNLIVCVQDCRNNADPESNHPGYTLYKVDEDGKILFESDFFDGEIFPEAYGFRVAQTTDGGYMCCCCVHPYDGEPDYINVEMFDAKGKSLWQKQYKDAAYTYSWPWMVETDGNDAIIVYAHGSNLDLRAKRLSATDGSEKWDVRFYRGGFDTTPIWTHIRVAPSPDGGVFCSWRDDRKGQGWFDQYIQYVKGDGTIGYPNKMNAVQVVYVNTEELNGLTTAQGEMVHNDKDHCNYMAYRVFSQGSQTWNGIGVQKIDDSGELLWDEAGVDVEEFRNNLAVGSISVQNAPDGGCVVFYQTGTHDNAYGGKNSYAAKFTPDGTKEWTRKIDNHFTYKVSQYSSPLIDNEYYVVSWEDRRDRESTMSGGYDRYAIRFNADGTFGKAAEGITTTEDLRYEGAQYFDVAGKQHATPAKGLNIVKTPFGVKKQIRK